MTTAAGSSVLTTMKRYLLFGAALSIFGLAAAPLFSQTQTTTSSSSSGYIQTSKIVGMKVKAQGGEEVGVVKDVVLDRSNGCMAYTVLSTGGSGARVTGQSKMVAVPWSVYSVAPDMTYLTTSVERDRIYNAPAFEYSRIGDTAFTTSIYSAFGVSGGVGVSNTATTGVNTQTQTTANTAGATTNSMNNPPPPAAGPNNNPSPGMNPSPAASASANAAPAANAAASASPATSASKSSRSAKGERSPASTRHKGEETTSGSGSTSSESDSEGTTSSSKSSKSKKGSSAERSTSEESTSAETGESPSGKKSSHKKSGSSSEGTTTEPSPGEQE